MSVRLLATRIAKHGRYFLQSYWKRDIHTNILEQNQGRTRQKRYTGAPAAARPTGLKSTQPVGVIAKQALNASLQSTSGGHVSSGIFRFGQHARKLFIDNILNRVTTTYSQELRQQATRKLFYGDSAPFFALVGVSLASGAGVLTKEDELEGVCWEIREAANRLQNTWTSDDVSDTLDAEFTINKLNIGPAIAKGCAAVVYAAAMKPDKAEVNTENASDPVRATQSSPIPINRSPMQQTMLRAEMMSPMVNMSRFVHNFGGSLDNVNALYNQNSAAVAFVEDLKSREETPAEAKRPEDGAQRMTSGGVQQMESLNVSDVSLSRYPLALKMMFNYDIQSNAMAILRAMYKETVPARQRRMNEASEEWERLIQNQTLVLPPHPNVVCMYGFFCDEVGNFPDGHLLYPIAQPQRINPLGYGRNMSLYLLMKRYDHSLRSLLDTRELPTRWKLLLLTQLLEAVAHVNRHGIAHRDLKSDNVLIEMSDDESPPVLVLSDFGCCLADKTHGLEVPYSSFDIDKGGNAALMAPEIINKQPGPFAVLNYHKSDLWACGALAYEIFGQRNPFYSSSGGVAWARGEQTYSLRNSDYKEEDLPPLTDECPAVVQQLIYNILQPNPGKRVSPDVAANVMQLFLWAPSQWLKPGGQPNSTEILQWLLSLTTKVISDGRFGSGPGNLNFSAPLSFQTNGRRTYVEYLLICSFLARARLRRIRGALNWIQNVVA